MDKNIEVSDLIPDDEDAIVKSGLQARHGVCTGQTDDMIGGLHADIFNQNRYMINGVTMKLRITRSKDCFVLMSADAESYTVDIVSAKLLIRKLKIAPSLALAHEKLMAKKNAKYPLTRVEFKVFHLPKGQTSFTHANLFLGQLPIRVVLGTVDNRAYNESHELNPFDFKHSDLNFLSIHLDGHQIPWVPVKTIFCQ